MPYGLMSLEEGGDLVLVAGELDDEGVVRDVHDLGAEEGGDLDDLGAGLGVALHLAEDELAGDVFDLLAGEVLDGDDVDQLVEGLDAAVEGGVVGDDGRGDARVGRVVGRADVEGLDVETAAWKACRRREPGRRTRFRRGRRACASS
jgi:hypothetical protein